MPMIRESSSFPFRKLMNVLSTKFRPLRSRSAVSTENMEYVIRFTAATKPSLSLRR